MLKVTDTGVVRHRQSLSDTLAHHSEIGRAWRRRSWRLKKYERLKKIHPPLEGNLMEKIDVREKCLSVDSPF